MPEFLTKIFDTRNLVTIISFFFTTLSFVSAFTFWYANNEKRKYGLERDFAHLRRNQEQISQGLQQLFVEIDSRFHTLERDILEMKSTAKNEKY